MKVESLKVMNQSLKKVVRARTADRFFYEAAKGRKDDHKKPAAGAQKKLITPSGARIPPAWTDVWITDDARSPIQAIGHDSKGRRVYLYSAEHMGRAAAAKFSRLKAFGKAYRSLIRKVKRDRQTTEAAAVLYLISKTGFRIGSDAETLAEVKAFGASTLRCSHIRVEGDKIAFDFIGKKGIRVSKVLKDQFLAGNLAAHCKKGNNRKIFKTTDDQIRAYLNSISKSSEFTVKDFRTYLGTLTAFRKIKNMEVPRNYREFRKSRKQVGETVARALGNSTTIALKSYVSPEVFCAWESSDVLPVEKSGGQPSSLKDQFLECVHYDQAVPMEEYRDEDPRERRG